MKCCILLALGLVIALANLGAVEIGFAYDIPRHHQLKSHYNTADHTDEYQVQQGFAPYLEIQGAPTRYYQGAIGISYQFPTEILHSETAHFSGSFNFIPIYLSNKLIIPEEPFLELIGNVGYNIFKASTEYKYNSKLSGGLYTAVGGGFCTHHIAFQLLYQINNGAMKTDNVNVKVRNTKISLTIGYRS